MNRRGRVGGWIVVATVAVVACALAVTAMAEGAANESATLRAVRQAGRIRCGVSNGLPGFSIQDASGRWNGFDVDYCRAVAAAVLGEAERVDFVPTSILQGLEALGHGEIDVLSRTVTITLRRATTLGLQAVGVTFFDGQGFLVRRNSGIRTLHQLAGRLICFQQGTTAEDNLKEVFSARRIDYIALPVNDFQQLVPALASGRCAAASADSVSLEVLRVSSLPDPDDYLVLRQRISKEPFGPMVRQGDDQWRSIAEWTLMAMIDAEELGVSRQTLPAFATSDNPRVQWLLGTRPGLGVGLGLDDGWARRIIAEVGNYGDVFEANLGGASPLKLDRGLNELWTRGGLLFAFPFR